MREPEKIAHEEPLKCSTWNIWAALSCALFCSFAAVDFLRVVAVFPCALLGRIADGDEAERKGAARGVEHGHDSVDAVFEGRDGEPDGTEAERRGFEQDVFRCVREVVVRELGMLRILAQDRHDDDGRACCAGRERARFRELDDGLAILDDIEFPRLLIHS